MQASLRPRGVQQALPCRDTLAGAQSSEGVPQENNPRVMFRPCIKYFSMFASC